MEKPTTSSVAPIEDLPFGVEPGAAIVAYVSGSEKGKHSECSDVHGFGVVITIDGRVARFGHHFSGNDNTTFNRGYLGAALTALEWFQRNAVLQHCAVKTNAEYIWRGGSEWLAGWIVDGRLSATHAKPVENSDLWQKVSDVMAEIVEPGIDWQPLSGPHDEQCFNLALSAAQFSALVARSKSPDAAIEAALKSLFDAVSEFDESIQRDFDIARAIERDRS